MSSATSSATEGRRGGRGVVVDAEAKQEYRPLCEDVRGQYIRQRLAPGSGRCQLTHY
jgi:hypothetical protein